MARTYGSWPYNLAQIAPETTPGTAVAATDIFRGIFGGFDDQRQVEVIEENIGELMPAERSRITKEGITIPMPATAMTFEQLPILFEMGIETTTPTGAGPYVYSYAFPTGGAVNTIKTYTFELGNRRVTDDLIKVPYCWLQEMELSGEAAGLWQMGGTIQGAREQALVSFAAASLPAVEEAVFAKTAFYVDDSGGTVGTTQYSGILVGARLSINTGLMWVPTGDGNLYPTAHKFGRPSCTFVFTYELEDGDSGTSFVAQERAFYRSQAIRLFQLKIPGSSGRDIEMRFAAKYDSVGAYSDNDGNTTVDFEGHVVYSSDDSLSFEVDVTNNLSALH